ncbi:MAG TPA: hypothetical protein VF691_04705 [Cytophagaceae bacterium]|jgi:phosphate transport system substrate-binding protein
MKKIVLIASFIATTTLAFSQSTDRVVITGSRFTYPLINKWIEEFKKVEPGVTFHVIPRGTPNVDSANLIINAHELASEEIRPGYKVLNFSRYVLLPVANEKNPLLGQYLKEGIEEKDLKKLFFKKYDPLAEFDQPKERAKDKDKYKPTVYTREQKACAPTTFAKNFGFVQQDIVGKPIGGDDQHLISAIRKDTNGITYNNLGFIYDLKTKEQQKGIRVIPLDLNGNGKLDANENFYSNLDEVITKLEAETHPEITTGYINISYPSDLKETHKNLSLFLTWVLNEGQKFNHEYGFLNLQEEILAKQKQTLVSAK